MEEEEERFLDVWEKPGRRRGSRLEAFRVDASSIRVVWADLVGGFSLGSGLGGMDSASERRDEVVIVAARGCVKESLGATAGISPICGLQQGGGSYARSL